MKTRKIQKMFVDWGCGFPVKLMNVPMIKVRNVWTPDINYNVFTLMVLRALSQKPARLTGAEVRFIRLHFEMTLQAFADRFSVSHVAVLKWERMKNRPTLMNWSTEKDLRLYILSELNSNPKDWVQLYRTLETKKESKKELLEFDLQKLAA